MLSLLSFLLWFLLPSWSTADLGPGISSPPNCSAAVPWPSRRAVFPVLFPLSPSHFRQVFELWHISEVFAHFKILRLRSCEFRIISIAILGISLLNLPSRTILSMSLSPNEISHTHMTLFLSYYTRSSLGSESRFDTPYNTRFNSRCLLSVISVITVIISNPVFRCRLHRIYPPKSLRVQISFRFLLSKYF